MGKTRVAFICVHNSCRSQIAEGQYSKLIDAIPEPDITISMGCNVGCPFIGRPFDDNWGLEDPTGGTDEEFKAVIEQIEKKILCLKQSL